MHGAKGGAPHGSRNGNYRSGAHTNEQKAARRDARDLIRCSMAFLENFHER